MVRLTRNPPNKLNSVVGDLDHYTVHRGYAAKANFCANLKFEIYYFCALARGDPEPGGSQEIAALPEDMQARFLWISELICRIGLEAVGPPHVKHLDGKIWEMRLKGRDGIARALYVIVAGQRVVVVRAFVKKTQKTPRPEIEMALRRAKEIK